MIAQKTMLLAKTGDQGLVLWLQLCIYAKFPQIDSIHSDWSQEGIFIYMVPTTRKQ